MEIYMEKISDLLDGKWVKFVFNRNRNLNCSAKKNNLQVKEGRLGIYVADATEVYVSNCEEMFEVMRSGQANRSVAATRMNAVSSRSHSIFQVVIMQKNTKTDTTKCG
jgi:hypothetical protein